MSKVRIFLITLIALIAIGAFVGLIFLFNHITQPLDLVYIFVGIIIIDIVFAFIIVNSTRYVYVKVSWLFTIVLLPFIGCALFCLFGLVPFTRKKWKENLKFQKEYIKYEDFTYSNKMQNDNSDIANIYRYSLKTIAKPVYENNDIRIIDSNKDLYVEVIRLIRSAKQFIHIATFIIHDGVFFRTIICELIKKAQSGIKVRFLYDWLGSYFKYHKSQLNQLKKVGVEVGIFNPKGINMFKGASNYRMHSKMIIVDNKEALYGDSNFGDQYLDISRKVHYWKLLNFTLSGQIVNSLNINFCNYWLDFTDYTVSKIRKQELINSFKSILQIQNVNTKVDMQLTTSEPNYEEKNLANLFVMLFSKAKQSIKIVTPYFLPTGGIVSALTTASWSGVDVKIILPSKPDPKRYIIPINRTEYKNLLDAKCSIYEYGGFIHSKYYIIDNKYVLIGSTNLDCRSLLMNFENVILINNENFAKKMVDIFEEDKLNSYLVDEQFWKKQRTWRIRILNSLINLYKPML